MRREVFIRKGHECLMSYEDNVVNIRFYRNDKCSIDGEFMVEYIYLDEDIYHYYYFDGYGPALDRFRYEVLTHVSDHSFDDFGTAICDSDESVDK